MRQAKRANSKYLKHRPPVQIGDDLVHRLFIACLARGGLKCPRELKSFDHVRNKARLYGSEGKRRNLPGFSSRLRATGIKRSVTDRKSRFSPLRKSRFSMMFSPPGTRSHPSGKRVVEPAQSICKRPAWFHAAFELIEILKVGTSTLDMYEQSSHTSTLTNAGAARRQPPPPTAGASATTTQYGESRRQLSRVSSIARKSTIEHSTPRNGARQQGDLHHSGAASSAATAADGNRLVRCSPPCL